MTVPSAACGSAMIAVSVISRHRRRGSTDEAASTAASSTGKAGSLSWAADTLIATQGAGSPSAHCSA